MAPMVNAADQETRHVVLLIRIQATGRVAAHLLERAAPSQGPTDGGDST